MAWCNCWVYSAVIKWWLHHSRRAFAVNWKLEPQWPSEKWKHPTGNLLACVQTWSELIPFSKVESPDWSWTDFHQNATSLLLGLGRGFNSVSKSHKSNPPFPWVVSGVLKIHMTVKDPWVDPLWTRLDSHVSQNLEFIIDIWNLNFSNDPNMFPHRSEQNNQWLLQNYMPLLISVLCDRIWAVQTRSPALDGFPLLIISGLYQEPLNPCARVTWSVRFQANPQCSKIKAQGPSALGKVVNYKQI